MVKQCVDRVVIPAASPHALNEKTPNHPYETCTVLMRVLAYSVASHSPLYEMSTSMKLAWTSSLKPLGPPEIKNGISDQQAGKAGVLLVGDSETIGPDEVIE
ncbi:hypothetical protein Tco_1030922 [Tanacetum coccineum]|uniref:Uncharacterized protein n=1 Tax=Tanacetum coccineum TaxID=301880 RepID=A0ABQ5G8W3_9ASTR